MRKIKVKFSKGRLRFLNGKPCKIYGALKAAKQKLLDMYCGYGYKNHCSVKSSQLSHPVNAHRIYEITV